MKRSGAPGLCCPPIVILVVQYDWLLLALPAPFLLYAEHFAPSIVSLALATLVGLWLLRWWAMRELFPRTVLNGPILCLLLTLPLSLYTSVDFTNSLPRLTSLLFGVAVFFAGARASARQEKVRYVLMLWFASALAIGLLSLLTTDWPSKLALLNKLTRHLPHITTGLTSVGDFGLHPNEVGGLLSLFVPLAMSVVVTRGPRAVEDAKLAHTSLMGIAVRLLDPFTRLGRSLWILALLLLTSLLVLTQSRSALFGTSLAVMLIGVVRSRRLRWFLPLAGVIGAATVLLAGPQSVVDALLGGNGITPNAGGSLDLASREEVWSRALFAIQDFPITGVGLNQFEPVIKVLYPLFLSGPDAHFTHAHNLVLQAAMDFGMGGVIAFVGILTATLLAGAHVYRTLHDDYERSIVLGLVAGLIGHQFYGLSDAAVRIGTKPSFEWWLFLGMIAGIYALVPRQTTAGWASLSLSRRAILLIWFLLTLIAVAVVGENALVGIFVAVLGGCAVGMIAVLVRPAGQ